VHVMEQVGALIIACIPSMERQSCDSARWVVSDAVLAVIVTRLGIALNSPSATVNLSSELRRHK
jgi:hypothetical protein